jgi:hypothetical protein
MRTTQLIALPLSALFFVLFIYWLAVQQVPPKPLKKTPIRIRPLEMVESADNKGLAAIIAEKLNHSITQPDHSKVMVHTGHLPSDLAALPLVQVKMYNKKPFSTEQYRFIPSDRMYLVMELENLEAGKHLLSASWTNPEGKTINKADHAITLPSAVAKHRSYFWLELMRNGTFTEMITGSEYKGNVYGSWKVEVHLNGRSIAVTHFLIQDI